MFPPCVQRFWPVPVFWASVVRPLIHLAECLRPMWKTSVCQCQTKWEMLNYGSLIQTSLVTNNTRLPVVRLSVSRIFVSLIRVRMRTHIHLWTISQHHSYSCGQSLSSCAMPSNDTFCVLHKHLKLMLWIS